MKNPEDCFRCETCEKSFFYEDSTAENGIYDFCSEECEKESRENTEDDFIHSKNMHK